jgi:Tol biopolymer transport system component
MSSRLHALVCVAVTLVVAAGARGATGDVPGKLVLATGGDGFSGRLEIATVNANGTGFVRLTRHDPSGFAPRWTTDGRSIVFSTSDRITGFGADWRMRSDGTHSRLLPAGWVSPSGRLVARRLGRGIEIVNAAGRRLRMLPLRLGEEDFYDGGLVWSGDERYIATSIGSETNEGDFVRSVVLRTDGRTRARLIGPRRDDSFFYASSWSPDSRTLLIDTSSSINYSTFALAPVPGGPLRRVLSDANRSGVHSWSPDGRAIAFVGRAGGIFTLRTRDRYIRVLARTHVTRDEARSIGISWSPSGREVAFADDSGISAVRVDNRRVRRITRRGAFSDPRWSPDGRRLTFSEGHEVFVVGAAGRTLTKVTHAIQDDAPVWSADHALIAFIRGPRGFDDASRISVEIMDATGARVRTVGRGYSPRWSPTGHRLAYVDVLPDDPAEMTVLRAGRIVVADVDAGTERQVAVGTAPTWSPDGSQLAYMRYTFDAYDTWRGEVATVTGCSLWIVPTAGGEPRKLVDGADIAPPPAATEGEEESESAQSGPVLFYRPAWSPDGRSIAISSGAGVGIVDPQTGAVRLLPERSTNVLSWSPDARHLALVREAFPDELVSLDIATGEERVVDPGREDFEHFRPVWSPDGTQLAFAGCDSSDDWEDCNVYVVGADGRGRRRVTRTDGPELWVDWGR